ncbi:MAG: hypothetical protein KAT11_01925 [Phycisphaerae bacterium]|nr:hypothetical protein [Phycisphaerae bacterium]
MLGKVALGLLILSVLGCGAGLIADDAFLYILSFMMLVWSILFGLLVLAVNVIWRLLPGDLKEIHRKKRGRFSTIFFSFVVFFYIVIGLVDEMYLRKSSGFVRLLGIVTIIIFATFLWWSLIRPSKVKTVVTGCVVFILFTLAVLFFNSVAFEAGGTVTSTDMQKIRSLPYLEWISAKEDMDKTGVVGHDPELALDGLNVYSSWTLPEAYLVDMGGEVVHKWSKRIAGCSRWKDHVELCKNGDLLILALDKMIICLDWNSNVKWKQELRVHHDVFPDEEKQKFYVLAREDAIVYWHGIPVPIVSDYIAVLSPQKGVERKIHLYELVKDRVKLPRIIRLYTGMFRFKELGKFFVHRIRNNWVCQHSLHFDIMHANSVEVMDRNVRGFCQKGDLLISVRELDLVAVLDIDKGQFVWTWGPGELSRQHDAQLLPNGNVLIFDNGRRNRFSRVVEIDPLSKKIVWEYKSDPLQKFYSARSGSNQRLSNGNTLIAESSKGRAFEVTKDGKIVWDYYNPKTKRKSHKRETIYRIRRFSDPQIRNLLEKDRDGEPKSP